jgi:hypothetical protein
MIEWVEFKDFDPTGEDVYLVCHKGNEVKYHIGIRFNNGHNYDNRGVTHAAKINFPVEKTLEEKLIEHYREAKNIDQRIPNIDRAIISDFAVIAKSHYEGKE